MQKTDIIKAEICEIGRRLFDKGFVASNDGNISVKINEDEIWTTPTGVSKGYMTPDMLVCINQKNEIISGVRNPSSEVKMHLLVYEKRPDVRAILHAHPPLSTAFAVCRKPLDKHYLPEGIVSLGDVPVTDYATPSTDAVPKSIEPFLENHNALLLANHGALVWDDHLLGAYYKLETMEYMAQMLINVEKIGGAVELPPDEVERLIKLRTFYKEYAK